MNDSIGQMPGSKKVLIVEDTQSVAEFLREMLMAFGHRADVSLSVQDAFASFEPGKYNLVITDYTMPGMNGVEFARQIKQQSPKQPIMLITGSTFSLADSAPGSMPIDVVLQKPFSVMEFQEILSELFAAQSPAGGSQEINQKSGSRPKPSHGQCSRV